MKPCVYWCWASVPAENYNHTFEPCKALCRWSCITAAGQGDRPPLCHLSCWEDCYGGEVGSICRAAEKTMSAGGKTCNARIKFSFFSSMCTHTQAPGRQEGTGPSGVGWVDRYTRQRVGGRSDWWPSTSRRSQDSVHSCVQNISGLSGGVFNGELKCNIPVQRQVPSWSSTSSRLTAHQHSLSKPIRVGMAGWVHLDLEVWITHTHTHTMMTNTGCATLHLQPGLTCHIEPDGIGGGPSSERLVCLKPEVVVARIAQLHHLNLEGAAGIAAANVAESHNSFDQELNAFFPQQMPARVLALPRASAVRQADLVGVGVVSKLPAAFRSNTKPHHPPDGVTWGKPERRACFKEEQKRSGRL